mmetsp:Transcript_8371/g.15635  ORF Transcript_8371/g.15635 Transcript_8371/m.15635 type:complete len:206 (+) Transcript_8371:10872-11489(+)
MGVKNSSLGSPAGSVYALEVQSEIKSVRQFTFSLSRNNFGLFRENRNDQVCCPFQALGYSIIPRISISAQFSIVLSVTDDFIASAFSFNSNTVLYPRSLVDSKGRSQSIWVLCSSSSSTHPHAFPLSAAYANGPPHIVDGPTSAGRSVGSVAPSVALPPQGAGGAAVHSARIFCPKTHGNRANPPEHIAFIDTMFGWSYPYCSPS